MKKRILILGGGISGERSISLKTAKAVKNSIKKKYNCRIVEPDENLTKNIDRFSEGKTLPDLVKDRNKDY